MLFENKTLINNYIEISIFNKKPTHKQITLFNRILNKDIEKIVNYAISGDDRLKKLIREEHGAFCSLDERKQLREDIFNHNYKVIFNQHGIDLFDFDELVYIASKLKKKFQEYLRYDIDVKIIYNIDDSDSDSNNNNIDDSDSDD